MVSHVELYVLSSFLAHTKDKELNKIVDACVKIYETGKWHSTICNSTWILTPSYIFESELAIINMVGGNRELLPLLFNAMVRSGIYDGHFYILEVDGEIVSHTLWFSPGHAMWKT